MVDELYPEICMFGKMEKISILMFENSRMSSSDGASSDFRLKKSFIIDKFC
jgi:hypothetical protein